MTTDMMAGIRTGYQYLLQITAVQWRTPTATMREGPPLRGTAMGEGMIIRLPKVHESETITTT